MLQITEMTGQRFNVATSIVIYVTMGWLIVFVLGAYAKFFPNRGSPSWRWAGCSIQGELCSMPSTNGSSGRMGSGIFVFWLGVSVTTWQYIGILPEHHQ